MNTRCVNKKFFTKVLHFCVLFAMYPIVAIFCVFISLYWQNRIVMFMQYQVAIEEKNLSFLLYFTSVLKKACLLYNFEFLN